MKFKIIFALLLPLFSFSQKNTGQLRDKLRQHPHDSVRARICYKLADLYVDQADSGLKYAKEALAICDRNLSVNRGSQVYLGIQGLTFLCLGSIYDKTEKAEFKKDKSRAYAKAVEALEQTNLNADLGTAYSNIATTLFDEGEKEKAFDYLFKSLHIKEIVGNKHKIANVLFTIGDCYRINYDFENAEKYLLKSIKKCEENNFNELLGWAYNSLSNAYDSKGYIEKSDEMLMKSLAVREKLGAKKELATTYQNVGVRAANKANYGKALDYYYKALAIAEELDYSEALGTCNYLIGDVYMAQAEYDKAREFYQKAKTFFQKNGHKAYEATCINNIGLVLLRTKKYDEALPYLAESFKINESLKDVNGQAVSLHNMGSAYFKLADLQKAKAYLFRTLEIKQKISNKPSITKTQNLIGNVYLAEQSLDSALVWADISYKNSTELKAPDLISDAALLLKSIYLKKKDYEAAMKHEEEYILMKDSIKSLSAKKTLAKSQLKYEYEKKEVMAQAEFEKKQAVAALELEKQNILIDKNNQSLLILSKENELNQLHLNKSELELKQKQIESDNRKKQVEILNKESEIKKAEAREKEQALKKQRLITYGFAAGGLLVLGLLFFAVKGYNQKKKDNLTITEQKREVEKQKDFAEQQHLLAEQQKRLVEEHQKEIIDSINYAQRIQRSLLASKSLLDKHLPDYFIFFKPKDIVSGDFYWAAKLSDNRFAVVTADSTGHGVPGAIMSMLNIACLNETVSKGTFLPNDILFETRKSIIEHLKNDGSPEGGKDGMDCSLISFDFDALKLSCSAANNPVWIIRDNELIEMKPDKMPVGKHDKDQQPFTLHEQQLVKGDIIYALTDGFPDQFGGPKGKKFMVKALKELLLNHVHLSLSEQKVKLEEAFRNWSGALEQIDDVTLIGIKV
jgi:tetratricopeptide (TPR) repeat protein/serine phosphatase RsbU (regulator of sigma subunit)